jgi:hypothetical protein
MSEANRSAESEDPYLSRPLNPSEAKVLEFRCILSPYIGPRDRSQRLRSIFRDRQFSPVQKRSLHLF